MANGILIVKGPATSGPRIVDPLSLTIWDLDVGTSETHSHKVDWTDQPVESGLDVTDHAIIQPDEVTISGIISDTPLGLALPLPDRAQSGYETLLRLKDERRLVTLVTGLKVYSDMGIVSVSAQRQPGQGQSVRPTVTLKKVRLVQSVTIPIPPEILKPPQKPSGSSAVDAGTQPTEALGVVDPVEGVDVLTEESDAVDIWADESIAAGLVDKFGTY